MKKFLAVCALISLLHAASFYVTNPIEFQTALTTAESNGEHDTITAATGNYSVTSTLTYSPGENYSLLIRGSGMNSTVLDGGDVIQMLHLQSYGNDAHFYIRNLVFQNGRSNSNGGGLNVEVNNAEIVIEFVDRHDEMVIKLLTNKKEQYGDYTHEAFVQEAQRRYEVVDQMELKGGKRVIYHLKPR